MRLTSHVSPTSLMLLFLVLRINGLFIGTSWAQDKNLFNLKVKERLIQEYTRNSVHDNANEFLVEFFLTYMDEIFIFTQGQWEEVQNSIHLFCQELHLPCASDDQWQVPLSEYYNQQMERRYQEQYRDQEELHEEIRSLMTSLEVIDSCTMDYLTTLTTGTENFNILTYEFQQIKKLINIKRLEKIPQFGQKAPLIHPHLTLISSLEDTSLLSSNLVGQLRELILNFQESYYSACPKKNNGPGMAYKTKEVLNSLEMIQQSFKVYFKYLPKIKEGLRNIKEYLSNDQDEHSGLMNELYINYHNYQLMVTLSQKLDLILKDFCLSVTTEEMENRCRALYQDLHSKIEELNFLNLGEMNVSQKNISSDPTLAKELTEFTELTEELDQTRKNIEQTMEKIRGLHESLYQQAGPTEKQKIQESINQENIQLKKYYELLKFLKIEIGKNQLKQGLTSLRSFIKRQNYLTGISPFTSTNNEW